MVIGNCRNNQGGVPENFHNYFVVTFDRDFNQVYTWNGDKLSAGTLESEGDHTGVILGFKTKRGEQINLKTASSFTSHDQAILNLNRETDSKDFEQVRADAKSAWNNEPGRIKIEGGTEDQQRTFYSCLYRMLLFPRIFYEINKDGKTVHYSPYNGEVLPGYMFTDNGFWDTFRALFPFTTLMYPSLNARIMEGILQQAGVCPV